MRQLRSLTILLAAALLVTACETPGPSSLATTLTTPAPTSAGPPASPASPGASPAGSPPGTAIATVRPSGATASPRASATPVSTAAPTGSADPTVCAGSDANRTFYANTAAAVAWDVYCPVLPKGWYVESGSFRAASGGSMVISYKTNTGLRIELKEGSVCTGSAATCGPLDSTIGPAAFGDRQGQMGRRAANLVLYVDPGASPAWQATATGLDEATFRSICAAFLKVPG